MRKAGCNDPPSISRKSGLNRAGKTGSVHAPGEDDSMGAATTELTDYLKGLIRNLPDHPIPGVMFRDITTLLADAQGLARTVEALAAPFLGQKIDKIAAIEARGFIIGGALACRLGAGFVPVRKKGKLPYKTISKSYELEYGRDELEIHVDAFKPGDKVLMVDDLIATGGTAVAAAELIRSVGAEILAACFIVDLPVLGGADKLRAVGVETRALVAF